MEATSHRLQVALLYWQSIPIVQQFRCCFAGDVFDPQTNVASGMPKAAVCVQDFAAQFILQFAIINALCCALHRSASRVIHRLEFVFHLAYQLHLNVTHR